MNISCQRDSCWSVDNSVWNAFRAEQDDGWDAMEGSISSDGCRPTVGAMKYGDALAIAKLATQLGEHLGHGHFS